MIKVTAAEALTSPAVLAKMKMAEMVPVNGNPPRSAFHLSYVVDADINPDKRLKVKRCTNGI